MNLDYLGWLQETATSTADVAGFSRPFFSEPVSRKFTIVLGSKDDEDDDEDKDKKKKKSHKKKKN